MKKVKFSIFNFQFSINSKIFKFPNWKLAGNSTQTGFTKNEILVVGGILVVIWTLAIFNFRGAKLAARDVQRKNDLKHVASALNDYLKEVSSYPESHDGRIVACGDLENLRPCQWGKDGISDYIDPLPEDPLAPPKHYSYLYFSNGRDFQLFAHLESNRDPEYKAAVEKRGLSCGPVVCNFGLANGKTPLDRELEVVEQ